MSAAPVLIIAPLLLFAFISILAGLWRTSLAYISAVVGGTLSLAAAVFGLFQVLTEGKLSYHLGGWPPPLGIEYVLDPLSAFMALIIVFVGLVVIVYPPKAGLYQVPQRAVPLHGMIMLLLAGLIGVVVTGDLFNLFVFLEIYSLSSYALIAIGGKHALVASFRYLMLGTVAGSFYLLGIGFIYFATGSLNMADVARLLPSLYASPAIIAAVALIFIGIGIKMALFPLHIWLPDAHSYAPSIIAAILASVQIEVAAYVLIRMLLSVFQLDYLRLQLPVMATVGWCGAAGIIFGSVMAIAQRDFKRMLAYSTIAQIGYIGVGIGLANPLGIIGALLHILNHAFMKGCLFLVAGGIRHETGLREIPWFVGLGRRMPLMMGAFAVAALSMVGIPPTAGFFSKWYLVRGSIEGGNWAFAVIIVASSLLTAVYFFRVIEKVFANPPPTSSTGTVQKCEPPPRILVPILILAVGVLVLGLSNAVIVTRVLEQVVAPLFSIAGGR
ncbi:MAG: monovalent cation/H+ antiporter subunit D family protein [Chloroflexi bacterium]|nr:monovalent cation/H+ antiporter subunit D family protein [Chloroflexota bacterium]